MRAVGLLRVELLESGTGELEVFWVGRAHEGDAGFAEDGVGCCG